MTGLRFLNCTCQYGTHSERRSLAPASAPDGLVYIRSPPTMPPQANLRDQLSAWLEQNRSRRCRILEGTADNPEAGAEGVFELKMAAGKAADLEYIRGARETPSAVATFAVRAQAAAGESKSLWTGDVARTLDDVAGSPRVRIPWGPVTRSGEHLIFVHLGGKQIQNCPVRVMVRPRGKTLAAASTLHPDLRESSRNPPQHLPLTDAKTGSPAPALPALPAITLSACQTGGCILVARDKYGNQRDKGGDSFFITAKYVPSQLSGSSRRRSSSSSKFGGREESPSRRGRGRGAAEVLAASGEAGSRGGIEGLDDDDDNDEMAVDSSTDFLTTSDGLDGTYTVRFSRARAGTYRLRAHLHGQAVRGELPIRVVPGPLHLPSCAVFGSGLHEAVAGSTATFDIFARDGVRNLIAGGGLSWMVRIEPRGDDDALDLVAAANEATSGLAITDAKDGRYHAAYVVGRTGRYLLHVCSRAGVEAEAQAGSLEEGELVPLKGSPFALTVRPSLDDPACVVLEPQSGLERAREGEPAVLEAGELAEVHMRVSGLERSVDDKEEQAILSQIRVEILRDGGSGHGEHGGGQGVTAGARAERASLDGGATRSRSPHPHRPLRFAGGRLRVSFTAIDASTGGGAYALHVSLGGRPLPASPVRFIVLPSATDAAASSLGAAFPPKHLWVASHLSPGRGGGRGGALVREDIDAPRSPDSVTMAGYYDGSGAHGGVRRSIGARGQGCRGRGPGDAGLLVLGSDGSLVTRREVEVEAGAPASLWVRARDRFGNDCREGGDAFRLQLVRAGSTSGGGGVSGGGRRKRRLRDLGTFDASRSERSRRWHLLCCLQS